MSEAPGDDNSPDPLQTLTLYFDPPIKHRAGSYDTMHLGEPTARQVRQAEAKLRNGVNVETLRLYQIALVAAVSGWPEDALGELPIRKLDEAGQFLARFTNLGLQTGMN